MRNKLKERITQADEQVKYEYEMLESMDFDNDEKEAKLKNLKDEVNDYCALIKAENELAETEANIAAKKHEVRQGWVNVALNVLKVIAGFGILSVLGTQEAIDEHNGDIPSLSVREGRKFFKTNILASWIKSK